MRRFTRQIQEVLLDNPLNTVDRPIDRLDLCELAGLERNSDDTLVDDSGRATALCDKDLAFQSTHTAGDL